MTEKCNQCRFCQKFVDRKSKGSIIIDEEVKNQFTQLTGLNLHLKSYWEIICVICLRSLQLSCDFQELLIDNEQKYRGLYPEDEGISEDEITQATPARPKPIKRKKPIQATPKTLQVAKRPKLCDKIDEDEDSMSSSSVEEMPPAKEKEKSKTDENGNELEKKKPAEYTSATSVDENEESFLCFHCPKTFPSTKSRSDHIFIHHMKRRYPCVVDGCDHEVLRRYNLVKHIKKQHTKLDAEAMAKEIEKAKKQNPTFECPGLKHN